MVAALTYPERVGRFVIGGSHIGTGSDRYLLANRPSEGSRATGEGLDEPSRENIRRYLAVYIDAEIGRPLSTKGEMICDRCWGMLAGGLGGVDVAAPSS